MNGFTDFLCIEGEPTTVSSISIDLAEFPAAAQKKLLGDLGLPLENGMTLAEVDAVLGAPRSRFDKVSSRVTHRYALKGRRTMSRAP